MFMWLYDLFIENTMKRILLGLLFSFCATVNLQASEQNMIKHILTNKTENMFYLYYTYDIDTKSDIKDCILFPKEKAIELSFEKGKPGDIRLPITIIVWGSVKRKDSCIQIGSRLYSFEIPMETGKNVDVHYTKAIISDR